MRFRAKLATEHVQLLFNLITPISRIAGGGGTQSGSNADGGTRLTNSSPFFYLNGGGSVIYLDPKIIRIASHGRSGGDGDGISSFAEILAKDGIFLEHKIESAADDAIMFEIDLAQLKMALQSVLAGGRRSALPQAPLHNSGVDQNDSPPNRINSTSFIVMKLAKRNKLPCLCLDGSTAGGSVAVHHTIPVRIMKAADLEYHLPPKINEPDVQLELPAERPLRTLVERLKSISPHVFIEGSMKGELTIRIDGDGASIRTFYSKLIPRFDECKDPNNHDSKCVLKVDSKKLNACLQWQATMALGRGMVNSALLCMVENEMLVLHASLNPAGLGFFTHYIPVHFLSDDQLE